MKSFHLFTMLLLAAAQLSGQEYIDYEMFGAAGDGVTDDQASIALAHKTANEKGLPVKVNPEKTYYIGGGDREIIIRTDTDFGEAHFIIDDRAVKNRTKDIFHVQSFSKPIEINCKTFRKTDRKLRCGKLQDDCLVEIFNEDKKIYIRKGLNRNNGTAQHECILVDRKGKVLSPVEWDYDKVTSAKAYPVDKEKLTIRGGIFTTIANTAESKYTYYSRGIKISRSNVVVEGMTHLVEGETDHGAPYTGFINISKSSGVTVKNCVLTAHKTFWTIGRADKPVMMGSYDLIISSSINTVIENCRQTTDIDDKAYWGLMASNFCKGITLDKCTFSRFDAHQGVTDVTLTNSTFGHMGTRAVGNGTLRIENCEVRANYLFTLRDDYGSTWDGDILVTNCTIRPQGGDKIRIIGGSNDGTHDFGYTCRLPRRIIIDGLLIDDSLLDRSDYYGPSVFPDFNQADNAAFPIVREGDIRIRGLEISSGKKLRISYYPENFTGYSMTVE